MAETDLERYRGKMLMLGISLYDKGWKFIRLLEVHGRITRIDLDKGIVVAVGEEGEEFRVPPNMEALQEAAPGEYREHSTGEVVQDPDFITLWQVSLSEGVEIDWSKPMSWRLGPRLQFPAHGE